MHRIDGAGATAGNLFTEGDASQGIAPTVVTDDWLNDIQENHIRAAEAMGITPVKGNYDQLAAAIRGVGLKNGIINGGFDIWQRGISFSNSGGSAIYSADRWLSNAGDGVSTISRQEFSPGQTAVPGNPAYYFRNNRSTAATAENGVAQQRIEGVRSYNGRKVALSFWAKADAAKTFGIEYFQQFGTGGSPSASGPVGTDSFTVSTSWQLFTFTFDVPSISGKVIGTDGNDFFAVTIKETSSFSTFTLDVAQAQIEEGAEASAFEKRPIGLELQLCQRYYEKSYTMNDKPGTAVDKGIQFVQPARTSTETGNRIRLRVPFISHKRGIPSVTHYDGAGNVGKITTIDGDTQTDNITPGSAVISNIATSGFTMVSVDGPMLFHWIADAEL